MTGWRTGALPRGPRRPLLRAAALLSACLSACLIGLPCAAAAQAAAAAKSTALPEPVRAALAASGLPPQAVGIVVLPLHTRAPAVAHNAENAMQPASVIKLVTTAVALDRLGANHRGSTELLSNAVQVGDELQGDLVMRGGADPELGLAQLWELLAELRFQGIARISGNIVLDRNLFRPARSDIGLAAFDDAPEFPYNVIPDALQLAGNLLAMDLQSDEKTVTARVLPALEGVEIVNRMGLVDGPCARWADGAQWQPPLTTRVGDVVRIELNGQFPKNCKQRPQLQLMERNDLAERLIRYTWTNLGGAWRGRVVEGATPAGARLLARRESRPWGEVLRMVNKRSDNPLTRMLFLSLGLRASASDPVTPTADLAAREVRRWFADKGIHSEGLVMDNGSGLSRSERITPLQLARVVQVAMRAPSAPEFLSGIPELGVDGYMRDRWGAASAQRRGRLKPGGLRNVASFAGVLLDADDRPCVMVIIINDNQVRRGRPVTDALVEWVTTTRFK